MINLISFIFCFLIFSPLFTFAQEDVFQVKAPNVMIIFDTSSSMNRGPDGTAIGSSPVCVDRAGKIQTTNGGAPPCDGSYSAYSFEGAGNHPYSKLYQAKLALKEIIDDVVQDRVNLGFATYAQTQREVRRGYYKRDRHFYRPNAWRWDKRYWKYYQDRHTYTAKSDASNRFKDYNNTTHTAVSVGYEFFIFHSATNSPGNNGVNEPPPFPPGTFILPLKHTVTSITYSAEYNEYTYTYRSDWHDHFSVVWKSQWKGNATPIMCTDEFPRSWGDGYLTYWPGDIHYDATPAYWECKGPSLESGHDYWAKEWTFLQFNDTSGCPAEHGSDNLLDTNPNNQYSRWYLADPADPTIPSASIRATGIACYHYSDYSYLGALGPSRPPPWSYFKTVGNCPPGDAGCNFQDAIQMPGYYPSKDAMGNFNNHPGTLDNHHFFINFPDDKDPVFTPAVRTGIRTRINSFLDLTPVQSPESGNYWTKLPVHASYGKTGLTSNTVESVYTPLADSLKYAFMYFNDYIRNYHSGDSSSQTIAQEVLCRGNYVILLTDGLESARCTPAGSESLCPSDGVGSPDYTLAPTKAANLRAINVRTFVIGFGTDIEGNQTLNNIASSGGTANAYFAIDLDSLKARLKTIFQTIISASYGRSNPVITKSGDRLFKGFFEFTADNSWKGGLHAYDVNKSTGSIITPQVWDAGEKLTDQGRGPVWTWKDNLLNPSRQLFDINTSLLYPLVYPNPRTEDLDGDAGVDDDDARTILGHTLDPYFDDRTLGGVHLPGYHKGQRPIISNKGWKLGDIYHSTPVLVAAPPFVFKENDYPSFYQNYKNRTQLVYVGANDGMLHGIKNTQGTASTDGREHVSIVPKSLLSAVRGLRSDHGFYVDGSPKVHDVFFNSLNPPEQWQKWRTIMITGLREGGPYYFAVDVTNPDGYSYGPEYPHVLWEWTDPNMGNSWAKPDIGKINDGGIIKYVAFVTGGYSTRNNEGNSFYIVDIETGTTLKKWANLGANDNKIPSGPTAFDANGDGLVDFVYFGDTKGTLWKVNLASSNTNQWRCDPLFTPSLVQRKPIFYSPTVVKNNDGKVLVFFGTGEELNLMTVTDNYFWEVWDDHGTGRIIGSNWPKILTGQKILSSPVVANYIVYFTSWLYTTGGEFCGAGSGRLNGLKISNGSNEGGLAGLVTLDPNDKPNPVTDHVVIGPGIPTSPVVTNGNIYVSTSVNAKNIIQIRFLGWPAAQSRSWREVF